ncbi:nucleoporin 88-like [Tubulanus polymorphus]|uniref:nucleoporin 88-like n=1 Tax=Tubulanus polymorphus TaxID=672921 RepID=UPI003DA62FF8
MAAPSWRKILNDHEIIHNLRITNEHIATSLKIKNLIALHDGDIYIWNSYSACISTINLKFIADYKNSQTLLCSVPPLFKVEKILLNSTGTRILAYGSNGISAIELPRRWGKYNLCEGGKSSISCRTIPIGERFFASHSKVKLLHAAWHPGGESHSHIALLTSDCAFSLYDLNDAEVAEQYVTLSENGVSLDVSSSKTHFNTALGDQPVSFDFGSSISVQTNRNSKSRIDVWPVYVLWGNGNVFRLLISPKEKFQANFVGPLAMLPPAEDNYGTDACSIMCLDTQPPILVIATCEGNLYHCIVLPKDDCDTASEISWSISESNNTLWEPVVAECTLYVYEKIELELSLTTVTLESDDPVIDDYTCPVHLLKDKATTSRYHCHHNAGVHTVALPWTLNLEKISDKLDSVAAFDHTEEAIVEHLICTKPISSSDENPVVGLGIVSDTLLGTALICMTSTFQCITLPLVSLFKPTAPVLMSSAETKPRSSPKNRLYREPFDQHIQKILKRGTSNPIIKTSSKTDLQPQECFQLLSRATQVFREEYIHKQDLAREEIKRRVHILREQKKQQVNDVELCLQSKGELSNNAENLATKYDDIMYLQTALVSRVEDVIRKVQKKVPIVSDAEKGMYRELKAMEESMKHLKNSLEQIKTKRDCQRRMIKQSETTAKSPSISNPQSTQIKSLLKDEGSKICELIKNVKLLQSQADFAVPPV